MLTAVLVAAVAWAIVAARLQPVRQRPLTRLAWSQFWLVVVNAVAGGITVLVKLNPYVVGFHFLLAFALLTTTTLTWHRARQSAAASPVGARPGATAWVLTAVAAVLVVLGTVVTGAGPHSGDSAEVHRIGVSWTAITAVHGATAVAVIALAALLVLQLRSGGGATALARRRVLVLLVVLAAQAVVGVVQALTGLPGAFVVVHLAGAALVWVGVLRVLLDTHPGLFGRVIPVRDLPAQERIGAPAR